MSNEKQIHSSDPSYLTAGGDKCTEIRRFFNRKARVTIDDGRVFVGVFHVVLVLTI